MCGCDCLGPCNCSVPDIGSFNLSGSHEFIDGPLTPQNHSTWLSEMHRWRDKCLAATGFSGEVYDNPVLAWTQSNYVQPQMHPFDRAFYSPEHGYTVSHWLEGLQRQYGGIDSALIWPGYPNMGADDRNQLDMIRAMPGFANGTVHAVIKQLHEASVSVLWPYSPWDTGTRKEPGEREVKYPNKWWDKEWPSAMAKFAKDTGADGYNLDATVLGGFDMREQYRVSVVEGHPVVVMPEGGGSAVDLSYSTLGWCEGNCQLGDVPTVDLFKWLERRHMELLVDRWAKDRTKDLQWAWFNGVGIVSWQNVWGTYNEITERDGEAIRRVATMLRYFGAQGFLQSTGWEPHTPSVRQPGVFASQWPLTHNGQTLWTLVNRDAVNKSGLQLAVVVSEPLGSSSSSSSRVGDYLWYDCYRGTEIHPERGRHDRHQLLLNFTLEAMGFGCVLGFPASVAEGHKAFLHHMHELTAKRPWLAGFSSHWKMAEITVAPNPPSRPIVPIHPRPPPALQKGAKPERTSSKDTATVPAAQSGQQQEQQEPQQKEVEPHTSPLPQMVGVSRALYHFNTTGTMIEGTDDFGVGAQFSWEPSARRAHQAWLTVPAFHIDRYPVTKAQYRRYLETESRGHHQTAAGKSNLYGTAVPATQSDRHNWLKTWVHHAPGGAAASVGDERGAEGAPRGEPRQLPMFKAGEGSTPVVHVSLREARRFCHAHGKRLPSTVEWQLACQGNAGPINQPFPWGSQEGTMGVQFPNLTTGRVYGGPVPVDAHSPQGDSSFGVGACLGHVWQYTDELHDPHTRSVITVGSSNYLPTALHYPANRWYFPRAMDLRLHNKYLLMDDSYERAGTIGFRCAVDAEPLPGIGCASDAAADAASSDRSPPLLCGTLQPVNARVELSASSLTPSQRAGGYDSIILDWAHFGLASNPHAVNRMAAAAAAGRITLTALDANGGTGGERGVGCIIGPRFSWRGGEPTVNKSLTNAAICQPQQQETLSEAGGGWEILATVGANTSSAVHLLSIYVAVSGRTEGTLIAELPDGETLWTDSHLGSTVVGAGNAAGTPPNAVVTAGVYHITFGHHPSPLLNWTPPRQEEIRVRWIPTALSTGKGNLTLAAAALEHVRDMGAAPSPSPSPPPSPGPGKECWLCNTRLHACEIGAFKPCFNTKAACENECSNNTTTL